MTKLQKSVFPQTFLRINIFETITSTRLWKYICKHSMSTALLSFSPRSINKAAHLQLNHPPAFSLDEPVSLRSRVRGFGHIGSHSGLVHSVQQVFGVHGQRVSGRQHLFLTLVLQRRDGVLLSQTHLTDQLGQILIQQLLSAFNLTNREQHTLYL